MKYEVIAEYTDEAGFHEIGSIVEPVDAEALLNYDGGPRIKLVEGQEAPAEEAVADEPVVAVDPALEGADQTVETPVESTEPEAPVEASTEAPVTE